MRSLVLSFLCSVLVFFTGCTSTPKGEVADLIYHNGILLTMEGEADKASSVAIKEGLILAVGEESLVPIHKGKDTQVIDLQGKTMLPGFIDAHSHMVMGMVLLGQANISSPPVSDVQSISDIVHKLQQHQANLNIPKGEWIVGWGYDPDLLAEKRHPTKLDLDDAFPDNPVFLMHVSGHMAIINSLALLQTGMDKNTPNPAGGMIVRLPNSNEPSGLVQETAVYAARKALPTPSPEQMMALLEEVQTLYASQGITTAQDGFTDYKTFQFLQQASAAGKLKLDVEILAGFLDMKDFFTHHLADFGKRTNRLRLAGVKVVSDGSPQGKTAFFSKPYLTEVPGCAHDCKGFPNLTKEQLAAVMKQCYEKGVQLYTHANGDGAIDLFLETHQAVMDALSEKPADLRSVIIHSQFARPDQLELYQKYKMIPSFFSNHAFFWGDTHLANLGAERADFLSPLKASMDKGIVCTNHTDFPITPIDQLYLLNTSVNRKSRSGKVLGKDQQLTPYEGLKAITINSAYQHKQEAEKGSIKTGKLADFVILDKNPLTVAPEEIKDIQVLETIKEGTSIFTKD